ncbi:SDR family NAD(P)-dependent oxidoreductase [Acidothermaceae bacterium B102]|nr:SDR family NAD(P)-dependent oxidoreductase [Acidothermaceae bacterium B102]
MTDTLRTAQDVVASIDLTGTLALVTGGYSGIGLETTKALASRGARVVVPARRPEVARTALADVAGAEVDELDLADLDSVRDFAGRFLASGRCLDMVIANAAIMACPETRVGAGWEAQLATNHLGHFALVNRLWPALCAGSARVVVVASGVSHMHWEDLQLTRGYERWEAYTQSKTANRLFAAELDLLGQSAGVRAFSVSPGYILTPLQRHLTRAEMVDAGWTDEDGHAVGDLFRSPAQGAATQVWTATSPALAGRGGLHCEDCAIVGPITVARTATDAAEATRLWQVSADLTGVDAFAARG